MEMYASVVAAYTLARTQHSQADVWGLQEGASFLVPGSKGYVLCSFRPTETNDIQAMLHSAEVRAILEDAFGQGFGNLDDFVTWQDLPTFSKSEVPEAPQQEIGKCPTCQKPIYLSAQGSAVPDCKCDAVKYLLPSV
jgi:hypothetical protein